MSTSVIFESPPGNVLSTRRFARGQELRIGGKVTGTLGLGEPFQAVQLYLEGDFDPIYQSSWTDLLGDYWFDIRLPDIDSQAVVTVVATFSLAGQDTVQVPIGIGDVRPPPPDRPGDQGGSLTDVLTLLPWLALGFGVLYAINTLKSTRR